ncbi:hypothetical protein EDD15DRAFT_1686728 [Pisolithus albus]|nr:hypothetical protein EDD15DRAFT_1686728 [Pisolithus albus]
MSSVTGCLPENNPGSGMKSRYHVRETVPADSDCSAIVCTVSFDAALLFCICCTQIVHALFCRPDTLARSYEIWLSNASGASRQAIKMVRDMKNSTFDVQDIDKIPQRSDLIPANRTALLAARALATGEPPYFGLYPPCNAIHPCVESCLRVPIPWLMAVFKWAFPIYGARIPN